MRRRWTSEEKSALFQHYPYISTKKLTELFDGRSEMALFKAAHQFGVKKCHDRLIEQGRENIAVRYAKREPGCAPFPAKQSLGGGSLPEISC